MSRTIVAAATLALAVTSLAPASMAQAALDIQASPSPAPSASPAMTTAMTLGARASSARARAFTVRAPKTVRTSERFRVTGAVPRSYAASPAVVEIRRGSSWIPVASAKVSRTGKVSVRAQLSQPGKHQLRVRVPRKPTAALLQTLTISSQGKAPTSYTVGLYAPSVCTSDDTCTTSLLASQTIDAITPRGPSGVFDLFTLGRNSKSGVYTVVVYATNALGDGGTARSSILITSGFIKRLAAAEDPVDIAGAKLPPTLEALTKLECRRGVLSGTMCKIL